MIFDFRCSSGHVFEANVKSDVRQVHCDCGQLAERLIAAPSLSIPFNGDYPGASYKWARAHEKGSKKYD